MSDVILEAVNISKRYQQRRRPPIWAVRSVDLALNSGQTIAVVGESGSGKSTLGRIIAGVLPFDEGTLAISGHRLSQVDAKLSRGLRRSVQLIHQDPFAALNPAHTVGNILRFPLNAMGIKSADRVRERVQDLLSSVGLTPPNRYVNQYPYQLSGGQRQRVVLARALAVNPKVLVADEAVSMIDVSMRQNILGIMKQLQVDYGLGIVFITHDLALARNFAQRGQTIVMYAGSIIECGSTEQVIQEPLHPYTAMLRDAVPDPDPTKAMGTLVPISSETPDLTWTREGCRFAPRCPFAVTLCVSSTPSLTSYTGEHSVACHRASLGVSWAMESEKKVT